jgi:hypothetical protein
VQPIAGLFFLSTSLELLSMKVALTLGREELEFNSAFETSASASLRPFGYRILCLQASFLVNWDDASLDDCCPTFRNNTVVSFSRVGMFIFLSLKTKQCVVSKSRAKMTHFRIAISKRNEDINCTAAGMSWGDLYLYSSILFRDILNFILLLISKVQDV